jgi:hypothetical protein
MSDEQNPKQKERLAELRKLLDQQYEIEYDMLKEAFGREVEGKTSKERSVNQIYRAGAIQKSVNVLGLIDKVITEIDTGKYQNRAKSQDHALNSVRSKESLAALLDVIDKKEETRTAEVQANKQAKKKGAG